MSTADSRIRFSAVMLCGLVRTSLALAVLLALAGSAAAAAPKKKEGRAGYGFLPGVRSPQQIERDWARRHGPSFWFGYPGYYRGRWNGGGFGPCWTQTPIGPVWNCGL